MVLEIYQTGGNCECFKFTRKDGLTVFIADEATSVDGDPAEKIWIFGIWDGDDDIAESSEEFTLSDAIKHAVAYVV